MLEMRDGRALFRVLNDRANEEIRLSSVRIMVHLALQYTSCICGITPLTRVYFQIRKELTVVEGDCLRPI